MTYSTSPKNVSGKYTCNEYRQEMILAGLQRRLSAADLSIEEQKQLIAEIKKLEIAMGLD